MGDYGLIKQRAKHISYKEYMVLKDLCRASKDLYNKALYIKRQDFFRIKAIRKSIQRSKLSQATKETLLRDKRIQLLTYNELYKLMKGEPEYTVLNTNMSQQILKLVDRSFRSFFGLLKLKGHKGYKERVRLPNYLNKDGYFTLIIGFIRLKGNKFTLPMNNKYQDKRKISFTIPNLLTGKKIKEIRIIPKQNARFFELQYIYEKESSNAIYDKNKALAIDLGINNLMTCVTNTGQSFIVDGRYIKSINQYANKENARLKSILDKQHLKSSLRLEKLWDKRNNMVNDYMLKACRYVVEYCKDKNIGTIVLGFNKDMTRYASPGKANNQKITRLPMGKIKTTLEYMCRWDHINFYTQEESYTSQSSFWDKDPIKKCAYSGKRIERGLYQTGTGALINADVNGALNILRKSKVVGLEALYTRGDVGPPRRIRLR